MKRNDTRQLNVNGQPWEYKIGRNTVAIYDVDGKRYFPKFTDIVGEKAVEDKDFYLNPATILNYIVTKILREGVIHKKCSSCGVVKPDVYLSPNPFRAEIYDNRTPHFFCNDCFAFLAEEI